VAELKRVYIYSVGNNCYKIGRTKHPPEERKRGWATGSPVKPKLYRDLLTEHPSVLENYIHHDLALKRRENGEFFNVRQDELDAAVDRAEAFTKELQPLAIEAKRLSRKKPTDKILDPTDDIRDLYRRLQEASREKYLLDRQIDLLVSRIKVAIGENCGIKGVAWWDWQERSTMDVKRFQEEHPILYEEYKRDSSCRVFRPERVDVPGNE
jgi:hypothetical protein